MRKLPSVDRSTPRRRAIVEPSASMTRRRGDIAPKRAVVETPRAGRIAGDHACQPRPMFRSGPEGKTICRASLPGPQPAVRRAKGPADDDRRGVLLPEGDNLFHFRQVQDVPAFRNRTSCDSSTRALHGDRFFSPARIGQMALDFRLGDRKGDGLRPSGSPRFVSQVIGKLILHPVVNPGLAHCGSS